MEAFAAPLNRLHEESAWFARAQEIKLLHVRTTAGLARTALRFIVGQECHADNKSLFFAFEDPFESVDEPEPRLREPLRLRVDLFA